MHLGPEVLFLVLAGPRAGRDPDGQRPERAAHPDGRDLEVVDRRPVRAREDREHDARERVVLVIVCLGVLRM